MSNVVPALMLLFFLSILHILISDSLKNAKFSSFIIERSLFLFFLYAHDQSLLNIEGLLLFLSASTVRNRRISAVQANKTTAEQHRLIEFLSPSSGKTDIMFDEQSAGILFAIERRQLDSKLK